MSKTPSPAVQKALTKLEANIAAGQAYEGHELFKTVFYRSRARKQLEDSYVLAESGSILQLKHSQANCGTELATMLLDAYMTDNTPSTTESLDRILHIIQAFPTKPCNEEEDPPIDRCNKVVAHGLKWLSSVHALHDAPLLHAAFAEYITQSLGWTGLGIAIPHYAISNTFDTFAEAVLDNVKLGRKEEEDLFVSRAVLQIVSTKPLPGQESGIHRGRKFLNVYSQVHALPDTPLMHFLTFFLEALEKKSSALVDLLLEKYKQCLESRDASLMQLVVKSRSMYAPAPVAMGGGGFLGEMMRGLLAG